MPDSFTPELNLTKPELSPGDVWGAKLNDNADAIDAFAVSSLAAIAANAAAIATKQDASTVLTSTTASFTTALQTKLNGIADGATAGWIGPLPLANPAGQFIGNAYDATALGTQAQVANRTVIAPFVTARNVSIDQVLISCSTAVASSLAKVVIFASGADGRPTTILRETVDIDCSTTGTRGQTITALTLTAGLTYWIGIRSNSTQTLRTLPVSACYPISYTNAATPAMNITLTRTETYATAATDWVYSSGQAGTVLAPLVLMRVA